MNENHWSKTNKRKDVLKKIKVGWKNLENSPYKKNGKVVICPICGTGRYRKKALVDRGVKYCSKRCYQISKKGIIPKNLKLAQSKSPIGTKGYVATEGKKHWNWQDKNPSYRAVHAWLNKKYGKANKCENKKCVYPRKNKRGYMMDKPKTHHWANISGKYKREKRDFIQLCASCHKQYDQGNLKI